MIKKTAIAVIYGGTSTEHEVSVVSAQSILKNLNPAKFEVFPVYITKENHWTYQEKNIDPFTWIPAHIDVIFPVLHGLYGEDGTIQGLLEMLHLPYVGCGVLASAMCMDKVIQKQLCLQQGLPIAPFVFTTKHDWEQNPKKTLTYISNKLTFPVFVKPANQGSSIGISKVADPSAITQAINDSLKFDTKVVIENGIPNSREFECAVLGNHQPKSSVLAEIKPNHEFYDYDAKYIDGQTDFIIPAKLPPQVTEKIQNYALKAFQLLNCYGLARVDFLVNAKTLEIYLSELNTMPGFTSISMYPELWKASGLTYPKLIETLIDLSIERFREQQNRQLSYDSSLLPL